MTLSIKEKLTKARASLIMTQPFFASLVCSMPMHEDATIVPPTMCTNGQWIKFHPDFVDACNVEEVKFVLCHEIGHSMFLHMFRRGQRHPVVWNHAGDYIINDMLVKEGIGAMPTGDRAGLLDATKVQAGGGTTEGVYDVIYQEIEQAGGIGKLGIGDQWDNCEEPGGTQAEQEQAAAEMKIAIQQAASAAKMCGKLGVSLERFVNQALRPKVDWKAVLRRFVSSKAKTERSFSRPRRRFMAEDIYLPGMSGEKLGEIAVAVDCSGSISQKEINEFAAEIRAIKEDMLPTKLHVVYFHSKVCKHDVFNEEDELVVSPNGTGGTAFSPIFKFLVEQGVEPECCVVLTDLCCSDFGDDPGYPVLWVSTHRGEAPWGEVILMKDKL